MLTLEQSEGDAFLVKRVRTNHNCPLKHFVELQKPATHLPEGIALIYSLGGYVVKCSFLLSFYLFGLGHRAVTTVEIPPLGRKSPLTSHHTGFAAFTTSSRIWFTIFS